MEKQQSAVEAATTWWMPLARGIMLIVFGILMFALGRGVTLIALIQFMGAYWLLGGIIDLFDGVVGRTENRSRIWMIVSAVISIAAGFFVMSHPIISGIFASQYLVLFMGIAAIFVGIAHIFSGRGKGRSIWGVVLGILYTIFGVTVVFNPVVTAAVIVAALPFWALIAGASSIMTALMGSRQPPAVEAQGR